jgi:formylmethanofuran dehydrogenase subunit C
MSGIRMRLRSELRDALDLAGAIATGWTSLGADDLARRRVWGPRLGPVEVGELFTVSGTADGTLHLEGDLRRAERLGAGLAEGTLIVEGDVGREAGALMAGGRLEIHGSAGDGVGLAMAGGVLVVMGSVGAGAGAAAAGAKRGMTGGELIIHGDAGDEAGARMRRGLVAVAGRAGRAAGLSMIAGTVVASGFGPDAGLFSKRGSLVALGPVTPLPSYRLACITQPVALRLLLRRLRDVHGFAVTTAQLEGFYRRYSGDFAESGKGELLAWTAA